MKTISFMLQIFVISLLLFTNVIKAQDELLPPGEMLIGNNSGDVIKIEVFPIGAVFNGDLEYNLTCKHTSNYYNYIVGATLSGIENGGGFYIDHDGRDDANAQGGAIGFGWYRIKFYKRISTNPDIYEYVNYIDTDWGDADFRTGSGYYGFNPLSPDMSIGYYGENDIRVWAEQYPIPLNHIVKIYDQSIRNSAWYKGPNKNGFKTTSTNNGEWLNFPL